MAIPKPNYTQTPNVFFDALMQGMNEAELKVTLVIIRETFGWHRQSVPLTLDDLVDKTGLSRQGVLNGVSDGQKRGTLERHKDGKSFAYSLTVYEVDQSTKLTDNSLRSRPSTVYEVDQSIYIEERKEIKGKKYAPWNRTKDPRQAAAEYAAGKASTNGIDKKAFTHLTNAVLEAVGLEALANAGDDKALDDAKTAANTLAAMGYDNPSSIKAIFDKWSQDDWRGQRGDRPTVPQFLTFASQSKISTVEAQPAVSDFAPVDFPLGD